MMPELIDLDPSEIDEACEVLASYIRVVPVNMIQGDHDAL